MAIATGESDAAKQKGRDETISPFDLIAVQVPASPHPAVARHRDADAID
ncbi:MAG: hypothetical protein ACK5OB_20835 [Pirellula sp.]